MPEGSEGGEGSYQVDTLGIIGDPRFGEIATEGHHEEGGHDPHRHGRDQALGDFVVETSRRYSQQQQGDGALREVDGDDV